MSEHERYLRCARMMYTCKTKAQLVGALKWVNLFVIEFGGFSFQYAISVATVRGGMMVKLGVLNEKFEADWS